MEPSAQAIANLPFAAFLILVGVVFFGLLIRGVLRFGREVERAEKSETEWKAVATQMTAVNAQQATQITQLTDMLERVVVKS